MKLKSHWENMTFRSKYNIFSVDKVIGIKYEQKIFASLGDEIAWHVIRKSMRINIFH
jgi:hypothetical protein